MKWPNEMHTLVSKFEVHNTVYYKSDNLALEVVHDDKSWRVYLKMSLKGFHVRDDDFGDFNKHGSLIGLVLF